MVRISHYLPLFAVTAAVAGIVMAAGPSSAASTLAVGGGFVLLHLHGAIRADRLERRLERERSAGQPGRKRLGAVPGRVIDGTASVHGAQGPVIDGDTDAEAGHGSGPRLAVVAPGDAEAVAEPMREGSEELAQYLETHSQLLGQDEEISFLPTFASEAVPGTEPSEDAFPSAPAAPSHVSRPPEDRAGDAHAPASGNVPIPRHFALGTVAIIRKLLEPSEVAHIMLEQRKQPRKRFGELAIEMGLLTHSEVESLLLAQQEGLFTDGEIHEARVRLQSFKTLEASPA
ncbi:MAG: hypothetical protein ACE5HQ_01050 [Gemmatimonadota bacterium]